MRREVRARDVGTGPGRIRGFLLRALKRQWRDYRKESCRAHEKFSESAIHQVRITIRRLLSTFSLLEAVLPPGGLGSAEPGVKKRLKTFSQLRDVHVQLIFIRKLRPKFSAAAIYHKSLEKKEGRLVKRISQKLSRARDRKLAKAIAQIKKRLRALPRGAAHQQAQFASVTNALRRAYSGAVRCYRSIRRTHTPTIHRARVAFKKFRYMMEALQPLRPEITKAQLEAMHDYQTRMGEIQDVEVLLDCISQFTRKRRLSGRSWQKLRAQLLRRRVQLIERYLESSDELLGYPLPKAPLRRTRQPSY